MINGDTVNGVWERLAYFPQCLIEATKGNAKSVDTLMLDLNVVDDDVFTGTPSRNLSNMLWETLDWNMLSMVLGGKVNVFDVACGRGHYGFRYEKLLDKGFESYTGIDIYRDKLFPDKFQHIQDSAENAHQYLDNHNLIVSQSGLEHIEHDFDTLDRITKVLCESGKPFVQVHLVPASASLFLFLWHGWRQYSKKNLGRISNLLTASYNVNVTLIPIGGWCSFITHAIYVTIPVLWSRISKKKYYDWDIEGSLASAKIKSAVLHDKRVNDRIPTFWAVVICRNDIRVENLFNVCRDGSEKLDRKFA